MSEKLKNKDKSQGTLKSGNTISELEWTEKRGMG